MRVDEVTQMDLALLTSRDAALWVLESGILKVPGPGIFRAWNLV